MVNFITWFYAFKLSSSDLVTKTKLFGKGNACFTMSYSTAPHWRPAWDCFCIVFHNFLYLFSCSSLCQLLNKLLTRSMSLIHTLFLSTWYIHLATSWMENPSMTDILASWEVCLLQCSSRLVKMIQVIPAFLCFWTCTPSFLYQDQFYLASLQKKTQIHHPIPQYVMLMNQVSYFVFHQDKFWRIYPDNYYVGNSTSILPAPHSSLFFKCLNEQRLKDILKVIFWHLFSHLIGGTITK